MKITKFQEYSMQDNMSWEFINSFDSIITESENHRTIMKDALSDLKLNTELVLTFGAGLGTFLPLVQNLLTNMKLEANANSALLLTVCAFTIIYIEEKKCRDASQEDTLVKDSKSMLEELRMHEIGNGTVKKVVKLFKSIMGIFNLIGKHIGTIVETFVDMFAYASILLPIMNGLAYLAGKYTLTVDSFIFNLSGLAMGIGTIIAKHGIMFILKKLKLKDTKKKEIIDEVDTSVVQKLSEFNPDVDEMINEQ